MLEKIKKKKKKGNNKKFKISKRIKFVLKKIGRAAGREKV